jgi:hypothetical protein
MRFVASADSLHEFPKHVIKVWQRFIPGRTSSKTVVNALNPAAALSIRFMSCSESFAGTSTVLTASSFILFWAISYLLCFASIKFLILVIYVLYKNFGLGVLKISSQHSSCLHQRSVWLGNKIPINFISNIKIMMLLFLSDKFKFLKILDVCHWDCH